MNVKKTNEQGPSTVHRMTRHENHVSDRAYYQFDNTEVPEVRGEVSPIETAAILPRHDLDGLASDVLRVERRRAVKKSGRLVPFDGDGHRAFHNDAKDRVPRGQREQRGAGTDVEGVFGNNGGGGGGGSRSLAGAGGFGQGSGQGELVS